MAEDENNQAPKRYFLMYDNTDLCTIDVEDDQGDWVKWEDVEKLLEKIETQKEALVRKQAPNK